MIKLMILRQITIKRIIEDESAIKPNCIKPNYMKNLHVFPNYCF